MVKVKEKGPSRKRQYRPEWEKKLEFKGWLSSAPPKSDKPDSAYCKWCRKFLRPHRSDLISHGDTNHHQEIGKTMISHAQKSLTDCGIGHISEESKINDIKLVLHCAVHSTIRAIDHLCELLKSFGNASSLLKLKLHRTKSAKLILNVIAPAFLTELIDDIGDGDFLIILDESTDVSTTKFLAYCVRYFSEKHQKIMTNFLGFSEVTVTTSDELYKTFNIFLKTLGLKLENLIGTDGASSLCGVRHSLYTLLKNDVPGLQLVRCTCHSIDLCASKAAEELPSHLVVLLSETNNWFSNSASRLKVFTDLYKELNPGTTPLKFISLSNTRWLVLYLANSIILKHLRELKLYFDTKAELVSDKRYMGRSLKAMYDDDTNYLYVTFLDGILRDVYQINLAFQKQNADVTKLYTELRLLLLSLVKRIIKPAFLRAMEGSQDPSTQLDRDDLNVVQRALEKANDEFGNSLLALDSRDLGDAFDRAVAQKHIPEEKLNLVKQRATNFIIRLCKELLLRLPVNLSVINSVKYFAPAVCLSSRCIPAKHLPWDLACEKNDRIAIESQWRRLQCLKLHEISPDFDESVPIIDFWIAVWKMRNVNGERTFGDLSLFVLRILSLPISNAEVERVFSIMANTKPKGRNRMLMPMLVALLRIKIHMKVLGCCCQNYEPTKDMLSRFNKNMYDKEALNDSESESALLEAFEAFEESVLAAEQAGSV